MDFIAGMYLCGTILLALALLGLILALASVMGYKEQDPNAEAWRNIKILEEEEAEDDQLA